MTSEDVYWMQQALLLANKAKTLDEVPVGAIITLNNESIGQGFNQPIGQCDPTHHAEMQAIREAAKAIDNYRLLDTTLYVTLEPCAMCAGAMIHARVKRVVFGTLDPKAGACGSVINLFNQSEFNHKPSLSGPLLEEPCGELLRAFFKEKRLRGRQPCTE